MTTNVQDESLLARLKIWELSPACADAHRDVEAKLQVTLEQIRQRRCTNAHGARVMLTRDGFRVWCQPNDSAYSIYDRYSKEDALRISRTSIARGYWSLQQLQTFADEPETSEIFAAMMETLGFRRSRRYTGWARRQKGDPSVTRTRSQTALIVSSDEFEAEHRSHVTGDNAQPDLGTSWSLEAAGDELERMLYFSLDVNPFTPLHTTLVDHMSRRFHLSREQPGFAFHGRNLTVTSEPSEDNADGKDHYVLVTTTIDGISREEVWPGRFRNQQAAEAFLAARLNLCEAAPS